MLLQRFTLSCLLLALATCVFCGGDGGGIVDPPRPRAFDGDWIISSVTTDYDDSCSFPDPPATPAGNEVSRIRQVGNELHYQHYQAQNWVWNGAAWVLEIGSGCDTDESYLCTLVGDDECVIDDTDGFETRMFTFNLVTPTQMTITGDFLDSEGGNTCGWSVDGSFSKCTDDCWPCD